MKTNNCGDLLEVQKVAIGDKTEAIIFRNQKEVLVSMKLPKKK
ncbi:MAG: hypothetical protein PHC28_00130 [Flavobacterium sp.]|nr:hypothetical protein [Flavobacterium sp.]MDD5148874.1 hypothetical protein [Flavobacterium sp.]